MLFVLVATVIVSGCVGQTTVDGTQPGPLPAPSDGNGQPPSPSPPPVPPPPQNLDDGVLGSLNHAFLQGLTFSKVVIEIDYVAGHEPTAAAKNAVKNFFESYADKTGGVSFSGGNVISETRQTYSAADLESVEKANRNHYTSGDTAVVYFMFINGQFENGGALGVAFKASSAALFVDRIDEATSALILYAQIEEAVAVHELGHLMGLVDINYKSARDHADAAHPGHSKNDDSVMFWAVEDVSLKNVLNFGPPDRFDADDAFDLAQIKAGAY